MSTARRPLGHGPQPTPSASSTREAEPSRQVRAAEADIEAAPPYLGGPLDVAQLRERGVLGAPPPTP